MKKVLVISQFSEGPEQNGNDRFKYISESLEHDYQTELIISSFFHTQKTHHNTSEQSNKKYKITFINEPGYNKNIGFQRFFSHYKFGKNLKDYLESISKPDLIYCAIPSVDACYAAARFANRNKIPFVIDIQDLWPEAFCMVLNVRVISSVIFYPIKKKADYCYSCAEAIVAVSDTYLERAKAVNQKRQFTETVFLGNNFKELDRCKLKGSVSKNQNEVWIIYAGTLGHSYDLKCAIKAYQIALKLITEDLQLKLIILGDGPLEIEFKKYASELSLNVNFLGRLEYVKMMEYLFSADIALNPIAHNAAGSIINKHGDYAAAGLPVISTQESSEYRKLLDKYNSGINCENGNALQMARSIVLLSENESLRQEMANNSRRMGEDYFDRNRTYPKIISLIDKLVSEGKDDL